MHVYLKDEPVRLRMEEVEARELVPSDSDLVPMAFFVAENDHPSFRALLPPETVVVLRDALEEPVTLGLLAEEPEDPAEEIHAMVGLAVPIADSELTGSEEPAEAEPWRASVEEPDAWKAENENFEDAESARTALLAFAPLIRLERRFPSDFGEELADLLETALSGVTRSALEARVDRFLNGG